MALGDIGAYQTSRDIGAYQTAGTALMWGSLAFEETDVKFTDVKIRHGNIEPSDLLLSGVEFLLVSAEGTPPLIAGVVASDTVGHRTVFRGTRAGGTLTNPTVPLTDDLVASLMGVIFDGVDSLKPTASVEFYVDGAISEKVRPMRIEFHTGELDSRTPRIIIGADGNISMTENLDVGGAISSASAVFSIVGPTDNVDVSGINILFIDNSSNAVTIGGFANGIDGQVLHVALINMGANDVTLEHNKVTATQKIFLHAGGDETLNTEYGGWALVCHDGVDWHDCSHSKHV